MIALTPPMGWNSWDFFANNINEEIVLNTIDSILQRGLKDAGYEYVVIDDCWQADKRDEKRRLMPDPVKFPNGIKPLADYAHAHGMKFGIYSCAGYRTCANKPGSYDHEFLDAETFASWDVDYLKYDFCHFPVHIHELCCDYYRRMGTALANCGRDILFNSCNWGINNAKEWVKTAGISAWRSTLDLVDSWESIKSVALQQPDLQPYNGQKCFNDMDMLVVGMHGKGYAGLTGCTDEEYRTHFCFWAMMGSPLMIGCDVRNMDEKSEALLKNAEVIAINQDPACSQPFLLNRQTDEGLWARQLSNGDYAVGFFNFLDRDAGRCLMLSDLGLGGVTGKGLDMKDLFTGEITHVDGWFCVEAPPHGCRMFRARVVDL